MVVNQKKIKILVASHKPCKVYQDDVYTPIHVGRVISSYKNEMFNVLGDDTGDNISKKNKSFCELTATYWAWKHLCDVKYVGLAHYRRYFETRFTESNVDEIFETCDVVLAKPILRDKHLDDKLSKVLSLEDYVILLKIIKKLYPDYEKTVIDYLFDFRDISLNMFIMKKEVFAKYADFTFDVLFECERVMKDLPYTCSMRRFGYIGEFLLPIFCLYNKLKIRYENIVPMIGEHISSNTNVKQTVKIFLLHKIYDKHKPSSLEEMYDCSVLNGLLCDRINI